MATVTRTFELSVEAAAELDRRAAVEQRDASDVLNELLLWGGGALAEDEFSPEQWKQVQEGLADADAGRFVSDEEVQAMLNTYRIRS